MRRIGFAVLLLITGAWGAAAQEGSLDLDAANAYYGCLRANAGRLDDGSSDADAVGRGVANACAEQRHQMAIRSTTGSSEQLKNMLQQALDASAKEDAITFVLATRKRKSQGL
jgi:hypothetical protein